jgi:hypothetical protein
MEKCWASDPEERPTFERICLELPALFNSIIYKKNDGATSNASGEYVFSST